MRLVLLACLLVGMMPDASAIYYGQSREELLRELGKPSSELKRGDREVLLYKTGRVELAFGKVAVVQGLAVTETPGAISSSTAVAPTLGDTPQAAPAAASTDNDRNSAQKASSEVSPKSESGGAVRSKLEKEIEALSTPPSIHEESTAPAPRRWLTFTVELLVKALMMLAALKLTTKYWGVEISWRGLVIAAAADTVARAIVGGLVLWALGVGSTLYADEAVGALVLVAVLRRVSYNQSLRQAVTVTITSKTFSIVVGSFLSVFVTRMLVGGGGGSLMPF